MCHLRIQRRFESCGEELVEIVCNAGGLVGTVTSFVKTMFVGATSLFAGKLAMAFEAGFNSACTMAIFVGKFSKLVVAVSTDAGG
jgi:hypothetical protein